MSLVRVSLCIFAAYLVYGALALAQVNGQQSPTSTTTATVPRLIQIKGSVRDEIGKPLSGNLGITFTLYQDANDQVGIWQEQQNVKLDSAGRYSVLLGATDEGGLPLEIFSSGNARWLGVRPDGQPEQPRILFLSVAYALKAADTEMLGGKPASAYVLAANLPSAAQPGSGTQVNAQPAPQILIPPIAGSAALTQSPQTACSAVTSDGTATVNQVAKFTSACNIENSAIFESGGNVGIGTTTPAGTLEVAGTAFIDGSLSAQGGAVMTPSGTATPSQGYISNPLDIEASLYNTTLGRAANYIWQWQAEPVGNDTASTSATLNLLYGVTGDVSETGISVNNNGIISFASGQTFPGAGTVTSVATGSGLTGGPITKTGTISIPAAGVTNSMLANSSITVTAGSGLSGGGTVALGGTVTLTNSAPSSGGTVTSVAAGTGLNASPSPITTSGTLSLNTTYTDGRYLQLTGGTLTGGLIGTTGTYSGALSAAAGAFGGAITAAGALLPTTGTATASKGFISNPLDWQASSYSSKTSSAVTQDFRFQAEPAGNDSSSPSGTLNLLFGSNGSTPAETGLSIASNGLITFASGQTFPGGGGTVTSVTAGAGLTASPNPITTTGTISIPAAAVTNSMLANSSITVAAGSGLSGGGTVALGGTVTLASNLSGATDGVAYFSSPTNLTSTPAPTNGQILIGSTGSAPVLGTLSAGSNITITNAPGSVTISAASGGVASLPFFATGGERTGAAQSPGKNVTQLWGFLLPFNVTTTQITYDVTTADDTTNDYDLGIYDNSGNLVVDIGPTPGTTFAPAKNFHTLAWAQGSTSLLAGRYYLAFTTNCTGTCAAISGTTAFVSFAIAVSGGTSTGGALPSTMTPPADKWGTGDQPTVVIH